MIAGTETSTAERELLGIPVMPHPLSSMQNSPQESPCYILQHPTPPLPQPPEAAERPPVGRCPAFFRYNAVQRTLSAAVLAPAVTVFLWLSPAIATSTVCSFMTSTCAYEYACLANRIRLRLLTRLQTLEYSVGNARRTGATSSDASPQQTRSESNSSSGSGNEVDVTASRTFVFDSTSNSQLHQRAASFQMDADRISARTTMTRAFQEEQEAQEIARVNCELRPQGSRLRRCAITEVAEFVFGGHEWIAAFCMSALLCSITSAAFMLMMEYMPQLVATEFYEARWFYTVATGFVSGLCACLAPDWQYAIVIILQNAIFTILTFHSTACPINQLACSMSIHPAHVFLCGMIVFLIFRFATCRSSAEAFLTFTLDVVGLIYIIGTLSVLVAFVDDERRTLYRKLLIALLYVVWASDTGSYVTGKLLTLAKYPHYNPLAAHLSKNKDYEGTVGAIGFGIVAMVASSEVLDLPGSFGTKVGFTVVAVIIGRLGDLFESLLKRAAGVKDSGTLIPGHGGVLDRIDALMFATLVFSRYYAMVY